MSSTRVIVLGVVRFEDKYLIGRRAATKKFAPNVYEFISGFVDTDESAEEIILRELNEETNLTGKISKKADIYVIEDEDARWIVIPFLVSASSGDFVVNEQDHSELRWVDGTELEKYLDLALDVEHLRSRGLID